MNKTFWIGLLSATLLTPAAYAAPADAVSSKASTAADGADANFRRGDGQRGSGQRSEGRRSGNWQGNSGQTQRDSGSWERRGNRGGTSGSYQNNPQPQPQAQPQRRGGSTATTRPIPETRNRGGNQDPNAGAWQGQNGRNWDRDNDRNRDANRGYSNNDRRRDDNRGYSYDRRGDDNRGGYGDNRRQDNRNGRDWNRRDDNRQWDRSWHNDRRYDWRGYRQSNRNIYRPGRYYAPDRYHSYRRFSIGIYLGSPFYGSNYWIADPWSYRLPEAYGPYRWVRYYDDVLLIDIRNGYVVDVIHDFFW